MKKYPIFGVDYCATDYEEASSILVYEAKRRNSYTCSALAVHGLMEAYMDKVFMDTVLRIDMVVPDGQPVRWAMNSFHRLNLKDRVNGPELMLHVLAKANEESLKVYLFGSAPETLAKLSKFISNNFPNIVICGTHPDRFREATEEEDQEDIAKLNRSGAHIVLVGRGCPRQEKWVTNHKGKVNAVMMAVGAAFDFHANNVKKAPKWMQQRGLEWLFRLMQEPGRLWKRYLTTNTLFIFLFVKQKLKPS